MPSYDLRREPWIPVTFHDGTTGEVGLRDALIRSHEIREVYTDSPAEVIALNRLLLALSVRIFHETEDEETWKEFWEKGKFEQQPIDDYFTKWEDRFDLLSNTYPFYQVTTKKGESLQPILYLKLEESAYTSSLFSHSDLKINETLSLNEAARGVVSTQYSAIGGLSSQPFRYTTNALFIKKAIVWIKGSSLFQALLLNAPPEDVARMGERNKKDVPVWEVNEDIRSEKRPHTGLLDYLTWQSRRLFLETEENELGEVVATGLRITGGDTLDPEVINDPHIAYYFHERLKGILPLGLREDRVLWRDATILFTKTNADQGAHPPLTLQWLDDNQSIAERHPLMLEVFGMVTDRAKISLWKRETIPLYSKYLRDISLAAQLSEVLTRAEEQARILRGAGRRIFDFLPATGDEQASRARALDLDGRFWASLQEPFLKVLEDLVSSDNQEEVLRGWTECLHRTAQNAFNNATRSLDSSGRHLQAVAVANKGLRPAAPYISKQGKPTEPSTTP
ncbi:MAG: type I-E CRISPR-associated protein Cse1/CasA [Candidatus Kapaibacterium sp.]